MKKSYQFEEIRLYAIFSFVSMSLIYIITSKYLVSFRDLRHNPFAGFFLIFLNLLVYNLIRYRYFSTVKYKSSWLFLIYGCLDLFCLNYYFDIPILDQGGKVVIMFILIMASIYRGRKIGIILTLCWFPIKIFSNYVFMDVVKNPARPNFQKIMTVQHIIDALFFQIMLLILVFITEVIYRQISNKEKENERLYNELEQHYEELAAAQDEIEVQNEILKKTNADLEVANEKLAYSIGEFFTLQQVSQAIGSILDMDELMKFVNDIILGIMGAKCSTIILFDDKSSKLKVHTTNVTEGKDYVSLSDNISCHILLNVLGSGTPVHDNNVDSSQYSFVSGRNVKSLICVPITAKFKKFGLILIEQNFQNAFDKDKVRLLNVIAQQVGMAMENADLYRNMHELAVRDNLTGAYNRRYFNQRLEAELSNSQNGEKELAVVMFDIDHFKRFNDTYGHLFGDKVLKDISDLISDAIRSSDVLARFGGEEFIIMMPETSLSEAYEIIEEVRKQITCREIKDDKVSASVTVSFGIASFPYTSSNMIELLKDADDALYEAKKSGRNCVKTSLTKKN